MAVKWDATRYGYAQRSQLCGAGRLCMQPTGGSTAHVSWAYRGRAEQTAAGLSRPRPARASGHPAYGWRGCTTQAGKVRVGGAAPGRGRASPPHAPACAHARTPGTPAATPPPARPRLRCTPSARSHRQPGGLLECSTSLGPRVMQKGCMQGCAPVQARQELAASQSALPSLVQRRNMASPSRLVNMVAD